MGSNPSSQKKKKKKGVKKPKKYRKFLSSKPIPNHKTKQKKAQICLPQQIPNFQYKNQKIEK